MQLLASKSVRERRKGRRAKKPWRASTSPHAPGHAVLHRASSASLTTLGQRGTDLQQVHRQHVRRRLGHADDEGAKRLRVQLRDSAERRQRLRRGRVADKRRRNEGPSAAQLSQQECLQGPRHACSVTLSVTFSVTLRVTLSHTRRHTQATRTQDGGGYLSICLLPLRIAAESEVAGNSVQSTNDSIAGLTDVKANQLRVRHTWCYHRHHTGIPSSHTHTHRAHATQETASRHHRHRV